MRPLGQVQRHVLAVLSTRGPSTRGDWAAWYPLRTEQIYGAVDGLSRRGLVDAVGFDGNARVIGLTDKGREAADAILDEYDPDDA